MLTTLLKPTAGSATVAGYDVVTESVQVRRSIGYVSQAGGAFSAARTGNEVMDSGILLPMTIGPAWLERASEFMPIRHVVDAVRSSFAGDFTASALMWGTLWSLVLFGLAVWWGTATFRRENA